MRIRIHNTDLNGYKPKNAKGTSTRYLLNKVQKQLKSKDFMGKSWVLHRCRLSWLTNRALVCEPKAGGGGGPQLAGGHQIVNRKTRAKKKICYKKTKLKNGKK
jgi:hypothetical protein